MMTTLQSGIYEGKVLYLRTFEILVAHETFQAGLITPN